MATYEEAMAALRKADAAGNVEDARRLAAIARSLKDQKEEPRQLGPVESLQSGARSIATGAAQLAGFPMDAVTMGARALGANLAPDQYGGSRNLQEFGSRLGITHPPGEEPKDFGSRLLQESGAALAPLGIGASIGKEALRAGRWATAKLVGSEAAAVAGATTGGQIARSQTDNPVTIALSELAGGLSPGAITKVPGTALAVARKAPVVGSVLKQTIPFTKTGGGLIASQRLQDLAADPAAAAERVLGDDVLETVGLSPSRLTGDKNLLALERSILDQNPALDAKFSALLEEANQKTQREARTFLGDPNRTKKLLAERRDYVLSLVDTRAAQAAREAQEAIAKLPNATERQISMAIKAKASKAFGEARQTEKALYNAINWDDPLTLSNAQEALKRLTSKRTDAADPDDIPGYVNKLLSHESPSVGFGIELRGRLLEDAAVARAKGNFNKARILDEIANGSEDGPGLLDDIGLVSDSAKTATDFSNKLNERFTRGRVGQLLGYSIDRGPKVDPSETLEFIDQGQDIGRANRLTELLKAAPDAKPEVQKYLATSFVNQATDDGLVNPRAAERFIEKYGEALDLFPDTRAQIETAITASQKAATRTGRAERITKAMGNQRMSRASLYLDGTVGEEWKRVLNADNPGEETVALMKQVRHDKDAVQGAKQGFVNELLRMAETPNVDEAGEIIVSGKKFRRNLTENGKIADLILSAEERGRLDKIANTLTRIEAKPGSPVPILDDKVSSLLDFVAGYLGARAGGQAGKEMGSSLVLAGRGSSFFRKMADKLTTNHAKKLLVGAVDDPVLYRSLLVGPTAGKSQQDAALKHINAWLAIPATPEQTVGQEEDQSEPWRLLPSDQTMNQGASQ